jgi:hypothetical protein
MNNDAKTFSVKRITVAIMMLVIGEGIYFANDIWRNYVNLHWAEPIKAGQREAADAATIKDPNEHRIALGQHTEITKHLFPIVW